MIWIITKMYWTMFWDKSAKNKISEDLARWSDGHGHSQCLPWIMEKNGNKAAVTKFGSFWWNSRRTILDANDFLCIENLLLKRLHWSREKLSMMSKFQLKTPISTFNRSLASCWCWIMSGLSTSHGQGCEDEYQSQDLWRANAKLLRWGINQRLLTTWCQYVDMMTQASYLNYSKPMMMNKTLEKTYQNDQKWYCWWQHYTNPLISNQSENRRTDNDAHA